MNDETDVNLNLDNSDETDVNLNLDNSDETDVNLNLDNSGKLTITGDSDYVLRTDGNGNAQWSIQKLFDTPLEVCCIVCDEPQELNRSMICAGCKTAIKTFRSAIGS